jgi:Ras GTPase-activating-like protein IQGAP2/3
VACPKEDVHFDSCDTEKFGNSSNKQVEDCYKGLGRVVRKMAYTISPTKSPYGRTSSPQTSPLRQVSTTSTNSSAYSGFSDPFAPSRTSTISSAASSGYDRVIGYKRDASTMNGHRHSNSTDSSPSNTYKSIRQSLRPLPQPPNAQPPIHKMSYSPTLEPVSQEDQIETYDGGYSRPYSPVLYNNPSTPPRGHSRAISLPPEDSSLQRSPTQLRGIHSHHNTVGLRQSTLPRPDLAEFKKSSTGYLKTLSKLSQENSDGGFSINAPLPSVVGLQGRKQLKRSDSLRAARPGKPQSPVGSEWSGRNWMDKQRQFLQAYEYLCHIGEAKEWIEDIIHKDLPPIVQLEEALRDGVTLAEVVQAFKPDRVIRIFRNNKLQFRHSDNIAVFFRFLNEVELPELFRFELVDLYEKKNIPKVIYCIHALSYLLYKNGMVSFRIGNLVGQLEFEHHELEAMQKGLDKAGVSMPNFSGMGANFGAEPEPEPEPVETEEERVDRELGERNDEIIELQTQIRGCLTRMKLGGVMQQLWDSEPILMQLQARIRGDFSRQIFEYRIGMKRFAVNLQSAARGFLVRQRQLSKEANWKSQEPMVVKLQSLFRARKERESIQFVKSKLRKEDSGIRQFQAAIRGALARKQVDEQFYQVQHAENDIADLQASIRGMLERKRYQQQATHLKQSQKSIMALQSAARAMATRIDQCKQQQALKENNPLWRALQAAARGVNQRAKVSELKEELQDHREVITRLQALGRANLVRNDVQELRASLQATSKDAIALQSSSRGLLLRARIAADRAALENCEPEIVDLQAACRAFCYRQNLSGFLDELHSNTEEITQLQALTRAMLVRLDVGADLALLDEEEPVIEVLQSAIRGMLVRAKFAEKQRFFRENMEKVVKVQSFVRARLQGQAYKSLTSGKNPPVGVVKNFVHLLNDSDFDFDEEIEFERLRKTVVQHVRQNEMADQYIQQLDIKIALLVKNKITLDEVVKHQKHFGGSIAAGLLRSPELASKDPFDLKALNKNSRKKLEHYQELFFILQTQSQYLARLFRKWREQATPEKETEKMKHLIMGVFGYAQKAREEYYLIKLMTRSIKEEVESCQAIQDYLRGSFFWHKIFNAYTKSPSDRKYLRELLGPLIRGIVENPNLDMESDPVIIYNAITQDEELRTGQRSSRNPHVSREEAVKDKRTMDIFVEHLQDLRECSGDILGALENMVERMPYGIRYIAQQMFHNLCLRFTHEEPGYLMQITGHWLWKNYLQPALVEPEKFGVIEKPLAPIQKKNLSEVAKVINQVAAGKLFGHENVFLKPLNSHVADSITQLNDIWNHCKFNICLD